MMGDRVAKYGHGVTGAGLIVTERFRQIGAEGYTVAHDVQDHDQGELAVAAWCYLGDLIDDQRYNEDEAPAEWPWELDAAIGCTWKPTPDDPIRQLVKAGALIAAEIDRHIAEAAAEEEF